MLFFKGEWQFSHGALLDKSYIYWYTEAMKNKDFYVYLFAGTLIVMVLVHMAGQVTEYRFKQNQPTYSEMSQKHGD